MVAEPPNVKSWPSTPVKTAVAPDVPAVKVVVPL